MNKRAKIIWIALIILLFLIFIWLTIYSPDTGEIIELPNKPSSRNTESVECYLVHGRLHCKYYDVDGSFTLYISGDSRVFRGVRGCVVLEVKSEATRSRPPN
jgi:hypothetical protein